MTTCMVITHFSRDRNKFEFFIFEALKSRKKNNNLKKTLKNIFIEPTQSVVKKGSILYNQ